MLGHDEHNLDSLLHQDKIALFPILHFSFDKFACGLDSACIGLKLFDLLFKAVEALFLPLPLRLFKFGDVCGIIEALDLLNSLLFTHSTAYIFFFNI